jgi:hypothetical protein
VAVIVSVPDIAVAVGFALVLLLVLPPDEEQAPTAAANMMAPIRPASLRMLTTPQGVAESSALHAAKQRWN